MPHTLKPTVQQPAGLKRGCSPQHRSDEERPIMFGRLTDWRRIAMRYDRCAHPFFSAIRIASAFIFHLTQ